jgi:putative hemolysin
MSRHIPSFSLRLAAGVTDLAASQALRFDVFVREKGGKGGPLTDHAAGLEADEFDPFCEHLLLFDPLRNDALVATTRIMTSAGAARAGRFATEDEFDLSRLRASGLTLMELGRTCLHPAYRGGSAMLRLWQGLAGLVEERGIDMIFGLASLPGTCPEAVAGSLNCLWLDYLAPDMLRPRSLCPVALPHRPDAALDRRSAMLATPALVKAYLRLGGRVGEGAFLDRDFGCIDVCMVLETATLSARTRAIYGGDRA